MCNHTFIIGDNYGESCMVCGAVVAGFGYNAVSNQCFHKWVECNYGEICLYCGMLKESFDFQIIENSQDFRW